MQYILIIANKKRVEVASIHKPLVFNNDKNIPVIQNIGFKGKIKKNLNCLISQSYENREVNDLVSNIEIFTSQQVNIIMTMKKK